MATWLLLWALLVALGAAEQKYFIQMTDIHMEENYKPGSDVNKRCVAGEGDAPNMGYIGCDLSDTVVLEYLQELHKMYPNPEFVIYTGDSNPHYVDVGYASSYTLEDVLHYAEKGLDLIHSAFPDSQLIPIMGNHDNYPSDQLTNNEAGFEHLKTIGTYFAKYIPESEVETFTTKGYYVHDISDDMRIIVMTTVLCDLINFYATFTGGEVDLGMFDAVTTELERARKEGKHVLMAFHRPAGIHENSTTFADFLPVCRNKLDVMYNEYKDIMTYGSYTGHTHLSSFRLFTDDKGLPTHTQFVCVGLTSYHRQQPGTIVYFYDDEKHIITDLVQQYMDMEESNAQNKVIIKEYNSFKEDFNIPDLTPSSMYEVYKKNVSDKDSDEFKNYVDRTFNHNPVLPEITNQVWAEIACSSGPVEPDRYKPCKESLLKGKPYTP